MAMFSGHILNGTTEILVGLYWLYNLLWRFLLGRREEELLRDGHGRKFRSALAFPSRWCPSFPVVPTLMCCVLTIGFIVEIQQRGTCNQTGLVDQHFYQLNNKGMLPIQQFYEQVEKNKMLHPHQPEVEHHHHHHGRRNAEKVEMNKIQSHHNAENATMNTKMHKASLLTTTVEIKKSGGNTIVEVHQHHGDNTRKVAHQHHGDNTAMNTTKNTTMTNATLPTATMENEESGCEGGIDNMLAEHLTAFFSFWMVAFYITVAFYYPNLMPDGEYFIFMLSLLMNAVLLSGHNHGAGELETHMHKFLFYNWLMVGAATMLEMKFRENPTIAFIRPIFIIIQGAWMNTIAYSLYSENPNLIWHHEHSSVMVANVVYGGHLVSGILVLFGMYAIVYSQVRRMTSLKVTNALDLEYGFQLPEKEPIKYQELFSSDTGVF